MFESKKKGEEESFTTFNMGQLPWALMIYIMRPWFKSKTFHLPGGNTGLFTV